MIPFEVGGVVFVCVFGAALLGMALRSILPQEHLNADSRDVVKLGMGLIGTMAALVLSLLIASAKGSYEAQRNELTQMSVNVVLLDRVMAHYGPETKQARDQLHAGVASMIQRVWPADPAHPVELDPAAAGTEVLYETIQGLAPASDAQRTLQAQALKIALDLGQTRWLLFEQSGSSIPLPFLVVLVFWLSIIFASFGLLAPRSATIAATLLVCALSVAGAVFLILELDQPFRGLIQISSAPLERALTHLGR